MDVKDTTRGVTRRGVLELAAGALAAGALADAATGQTGFVVEQAGDCVPVTPLSGSEPVEEFYDYQLPAGRYAGENGASDDGGPYFSSRGTQDLQRSDASLVFLYDGPEGLSLVVLHGSTETSQQGGGSATFTLTGMPVDGSWVVKDDLYRDPATGRQDESNYDRWRADGDTHQVSWTWSNGGTDGGAFRDITAALAAGVTIDPAFNGDAERLEHNYEGQVTDWFVVTGSASNPEFHALALDQPVTLRAGSCEDGGGGAGDGDDGDDDPEDDEEREEGEGTEREDDEETEEEDADDDRDDDDRDDNDRDDDGESYTICHEPPGNPANAHTIEVGSQQAVDEHLSHGDTLGPCDE